MITIVDYGMGNLGSILNMFKKIGVESKLSSNFNEIEEASKLILPGVGAFDNAMLKIKELGLKDLLDYKALDEKIPILGICLGMQLMTINSEEGSKAGFGWINAHTKKFNFNNISKLKIPHMGWNKTLISNNNPITYDLIEESKFYFVHSYYVNVINEKDSILKTTHGIEFDSAITNNLNIYGVQFHPEKSHKFGMKLFENFAKI
tara:strand:+ start:2625 stop:3239 length:615 start_codon:yes stop_codon:yes gene_type:complete